VTAVSTASGTATKNAAAAPLAPMDKSPVVLALIVTGFTFLGAALV
jgi:hypothetical protein